eukprot:CAMPEP_0197076780 /NCGR_PEP_ID=MMETSP1384-20130603/212286_1 /TAXON_ID=29189 /ORGANISM="Ammonia sp." /LENGTH=747 /DNA_ID=CAMNT_0042515639 /DNA_START=120 /DNA_END=2364 /DNA_ORIENTATION=+
MEPTEEAAPLNMLQRDPNTKSQASARLLTFLSKSNAPPQMTIEFKNMSAKVAKMPGSKETKVILNNVTGRIEPGQLVALMGPSGAGKSTLLNVLGSRFTGEYSGDVYINNEARSKRFKKHIGYVLQNDTLLPNLTVKETLMITAMLRLPNTISKKEKEQRVDDIISVMGLNTCEHTLVQNASGGESKRVSIANELLINPSILFLDEPTSGLDSTSAYSILTTLQELCRQGRTVICAIHQPSSQMFMKFDRLLLLASANVIYFGSAAEVIPYFETTGYKCPIHYNPADFILELVTDNFASEDEQLKDKEKIKHALIAAWKTYTKETNSHLYHAPDIQQNEPPLEHAQNGQTSNGHTSTEMDEVDLNSPVNATKPPVVQKKQLASLPSPDIQQNEPPLEHAQNGHTSNGHTSTEMDEVDLNSPVNATKPPVKHKLNSSSTDADVDETDIKIDTKTSTETTDKKRWKTTWWEQFKVLYMRAFKHRRGHLWSWMRVIEIFGIAGLGGLVWFRIDHTEPNINDYMAASFYISGTTMFNVMFRGVIHFPVERAVIKKERQSGAYRLSAYFVSKVMAEFPVDICLPLIALSVFYWLAGMADDFVTYLWYLVTNAIALLAANSFGIMCGASVSDFDKAITLLAVLGLFMMTLGGFMVKDRAIPEWIRWLKYLSFMRYGYLGLVMVCLSFATFECSEPSSYVECDTMDVIDGNTVLVTFGINETYWMSMVLLFALMMVFFLIGYVFLRRNTATPGG